MAGTVVLDASALYAFLVEEPAHSEVETILRGQPPPSISASNLAEVVDRAVRVGGASQVVLRRHINLLIAAGLEIEPVWLPTARLAAQLRADHYNRTDSRVSLADCVCLATAMRIKASVATTDSALASVCRAVGVTVIALPNSKGTRPSA